MPDRRPPTGEAAQAGPSAQASADDGVFRHRGVDTTRLEAFIDAAFAFALTLLVISFDAVPQSYEELTTALKATPAFLFAFCILAMFWFGHRNWSRRYGLDTIFSTVVSLALVFILLVYVYPLRAMAAAAISVMTAGWLPAEFRIESFAEVRGLFVIYGTGFALSNACLVLLNWHALRRADSLGLTPAERFLTRIEIEMWMIVGAAGIVSAVLAVTLPDGVVGAAGWIYSSLAVVMPLHGVMTSRRFRARFGDAPNGSRGNGHAAAADEGTSG